MVSLLVHRSNVHGSCQHMSRKYPVKNINFSSSKKLKQNLDKAVDDVITPLPKQDECVTSTRSDTATRDSVSRSEDEKNDFDKALNSC